MTGTAEQIVHSEGTVGQLQLGWASRYLAPTYARPQCLFTDGRGCELEAAGGTRYLDMTSGIGVLALGHRSGVVLDAIREATEGLIHVSNLYHSGPPALLARALVRRSFADRVFFCNSGAEAVEGAIKFARLAAGPERSTIVYFDGSFHGRTMGALAATDRPDYQRPFRPLAGGFQRAPFGDGGALGQLDETVAAVLVEPIQGESGVHVAPDEWLRAVRARCNEIGALLILDEVQCGLGRSGRLWAHEWAGVAPDLMTLAKPLAGGLPIGAVLMTERVAGALTPGCHGTTFGGGPLVTHVALRVLQAIDDDALLGAVQARGRYLREALARLDTPRVTDVRGRGLMVGVEVSVPAGEVVRHAAEEGLLVVPAGGDVVRLLPPLTVTEAELDEAVGRLERALQRVPGESQR